MTKELEKKIILPDSLFIILKIEEIISKLIEDYHIPEGKITEKAVKDILSLFQSEMLKLIDDIFSRLPSKYDPMNREEMLEVIGDLRKTFEDKIKKL